jgi:transaldolase
MTKLDEVYETGQAIWFDFIRRSLITSGGLQDLIDQGVKGVTSNPTIFEKAIAGSTDYDSDIQKLLQQKKTDLEIYEALVLDDIAGAADTMLSVYEKTEGKDGYVSVEVNPELANDTEGTIAEARLLFSQLKRPNIMIKVPATPAGVPAIERLISEGINVNVTLIFSLSHYEPIAEAYINGLEKLADSGGNISHTCSVASFFVSRVDGVVDKELEERSRKDLAGKTAIANAKLAYVKYGEIFSGPRWEALAKKGARVQRVLWASTSTKNPSYLDTLYIDNLLGEDTVNTVPPATLEAFLDHGKTDPVLTEGLEDARTHLRAVAEAGIDLDAVTQELQDRGVDAFAESFNSLISSISEKRRRLAS